MSFAQSVAAELFKRIDVRLTWHAGQVPDSKRDPHAILIRMLEHAPVTASPFALAAARPFGINNGPEITI